MVSLLGVPASAFDKAAARIAFGDSLLASLMATGVQGNASKAFVVITGTRDDRASQATRRNIAVAADVEMTSAEGNRYRRRHVKHVDTPSLIVDFYLSSHDATFIFQATTLVVFASNASNAVVSKTGLTVEMATTLGASFKSSYAGALQMSSSSSAFTGASIVWIMLAVKNISSLNSTMSGRVSLLTVQQRVYSTIEIVGIAASALIISSIFAAIIIYTCKNRRQEVRVSPGFSAIAAVTTSLRTTSAAVPAAIYPGLLVAAAAASRRRAVTVNPSISIHTSPRLLTTTTTSQAVSRQRSATASPSISTTISTTTGLLTTSFNAMSRRRPISVSDIIPSISTASDEADGDKTAAATSVFTHQSHRRNESTGNHNLQFAQFSSLTSKFKSSLSTNTNNFVKDVDIDLDSVDLHCGIGIGTARGVTPATPATTTTIVKNATPSPASARTSVDIIPFGFRSTSREPLRGKSPPLPSLGLSSWPRKPFTAWQLSEEES